MSTSWITVKLSSSDMVGMMVGSDTSSRDLLRKQIESHEELMLHMMPFDYNPSPLASAKRGFAKNGI